MSIQGSRAGSGVRSEVASLLAARRPAALPALERELAGRQPDADTLIRLAELLARGGRRSESARLLRGVIEEQASAGRLVRALAALKRLERLGASDDGLVEGLARRVLDGLPPPATPTVEEAVVAGEPVAATSVPEIVPPPAQEPPVVAGAPSAAEAAEAAPEEEEGPTDPGEPTPVLAVVPVEEPRSTEPGGPEPVVTPDSVGPEGPGAAAAEGEAPPEVTTPTTASGPIEVGVSRPSGMAFRLRTVFRRLLSLEEGEGEPTASEQPAAQAASPPALTASGPLAAVDEPAATVAEPPMAEPPSSAEPSVAAESAAAAETAPGPEVQEPAVAPLVEEAEPEPAHPEQSAEVTAAAAPLAPVAPDQPEAPAQLAGTPEGSAPAEAAAVAVPAEGGDPGGQQDALQSLPVPRPLAVEEADGERPGKRESGFFRSLWRRIVGDDEDQPGTTESAALSPEAVERPPSVQGLAPGPVEEPAAAPVAPVSELGALPEVDLATGSGTGAPPAADLATGPGTDTPHAEIAAATAALESLFAPSEPASGAASAEALSEAAEPPPSGAAPEPSPPLADLPLAESAATGQPPEEAFQGQLLDMIQDILHQPVESAPEPEPPPHPEARYIASPLFAGLSEAELMSVIQGLDLVTCEPGQILFTEGEPGDSLFILTTGAVKAWIRNPLGHSVQVREMKEGDFFGEVAVLSGQPRSATVVAAGACELFRLDRPTLDRISAAYPKVRATLEAAYQVRTGSPEEKTIRQALIVDSTTEAKAEEVLRAYFGDRAWDPRMRLRLADLLLKSGKQQQALPILVELADDLIREGFAEKAIAILKKIERIQGRPASEVPLADLLEAEERQRRARRPAAAEAPRPRVRGAALQSFLQDWVVDLVRDTVARGQQAPAPSSRGLSASPLFADFTEDELLALIRGLRLTSCEPGEVILTEGEPGSSVFILASGSVRVHVRGPHGGDVEIVQLPEGDFFGEISALSGRPRSATVTAAARCELLELDHRALDSLATTHPRVRAVLEETYIARASSPLAAQARSGQARRTG